jgi:hypothetical protein
MFVPTQCVWGGGYTHPMASGNVQQTSYDLIDLSCFVILQAGIQQAPRRSGSQTSTSHSPQTTTSNEALCPWHFLRLIEERLCCVIPSGFRPWYWSFSLRSYLQRSHKPAVTVASCVRSIRRRSMAIQSRFHRRSRPSLKPKTSTVVARAWRTMT